MPCHHAPHAPNVGPILFARDENIAYVMPHGTARAVMSCMHRATHARRHASHPNEYGAPEITYGRAVRASQTIFIKIKHLTF